MQLFVFDHYMKELRTILTESDVISAVETKEINKAGTLDVEVPLKRFDIKETDMLLVWTGKENRYHVYRVIQRTVNNSILTIKANEYAYHLFKADGIIHDKRPNNMPIKDLLEHVIIDNGDEGIYGWTVGYVSSDLPAFTGNFYREDRLSCLSKIASACNVEFEFIFTIKNNKIDQRIIEAYDEIGVDTGKRFEYGDNLLSVVAETDASEIYTRAYGYGAGVPTGDGYGHKLDLTGIEWSSDAGYPVTKVGWWDFMLDTRGNWKDYQLDNGTDPSTIFDFPDCKVENGEDQEEIKRAKEELAWLTFNALQEVNRPKVQFKVQVAYAGELKLGDRVNIVRSDINVRYKTRVFKTVRDLVNPVLTTVELGDKVGTTTGEMIESITNQITSTTNQITDIKNNIDIIENNTGNHVFYGPDRPEGHKVGDVWFETHEIEGGTQTIIHVWDGERWVISYDPKIFEELNKVIEEAKKQTEEAIKRADEAVAKGEALEKEFEESVVDITNKVDNAVDKINENKEETDKKLNEAIKDFENKNNATSEKVGEAIKNFEENKNDLTNKITEVDKKADGIQTTVKDLQENTESKFTQLDSVIQSKVSKDEYEASQTITNNKIEQIVKDNTENAEKISKVEQTAEGIQSSVTDLENKTSSKITQLDNAIQQKVNKEDFEATTEILGNQITQTVKKVDNIKIGTVNLIENSSPMPELKTYPDDVKSEKDEDWQRYNIDDAHDKEILPVLDKWLHLAQDVDYVQQITVKTDAEIKQCWFSFFTNENGHDWRDASLKKIDDNIYVMYVSYIGKGLDTRLIDIWLRFDGGSFVEFQHPQIERGTLLSDWSLNPNNLPNAEEISEIKQKADSIELSVKDLKENTESRLTILDDAIQSKVNKDEFEASQTIVKDQISQVVKDTTANAEKISEINQKADGIQANVTDLENNTNSKLTILDDLVKTTVSQIGASYPNGTFNDNDVHKYYETFNDKTTIEDYVKGTGLVFQAETGDSPRYLQTSYTDYEHFPNFNNLMWFDFEHELTFEGNGNVYVQIYKYNEAGDEINHEFFNLDANKGRINQTHNFFYDSGSVHHVRWCIGANLSEHSKFELRLYKMRFGANGDESQWNMYLKDSHYDRYFDKNGYISPITANSNNKVLKLDGDINNPDSFSNAKLKDFIKVNPKEKLTVTFNSLVEYSYKSKRECFILLHQFNANKEKIKEDKRWIKYDRSSEWFENKQEYDLESNTEYVKVEFIYWYKGTPETTTLYIDNVYVQNGKENISSSISQLANNINIKVDKNDVINQINVSDEEVLIQGNRIHLTGQTMIDDAIITSAMIKDLTADKLTAGTINGDKINVVNVRAENIVGNTTSFVQSAWNSVNGSIQIDGNSLKIFNKGNGERIDFSNASLKFLASSGYEICGLSRFGDGQVRLAINQGYHFYLMHRPQGYPEGTYSEIIGFDGRDGHMGVPSGRKIFINGTGESLMFGLMTNNGWGTVPFFGNDSWDGISFGRGKVFVNAGGSYHAI